MYIYICVCVCMYIEADEYMTPQCSRRWRVVAMRGGVTELMNCCR